MLEVGRGFDLGQEALRAHDRGQLRLENLERHLPFVLQVLGEVDRSHAAFADFTLDAVTAFQGRVQADDGIGHGAQDAGRLSVVPAYRWPPPPPTPPPPPVPPPPPPRPPRPR